MTSQTQFRVGLVGAGYVCQFHVLALRRLPNVQLVGIMDRDASRASAAVERFGIPRSFPSLKEMVSEGIDVVHVLTPPASHADVAVEAMERGCHVLVEKPLAMSLEECDRIAAVSKSTGKTVCVNHSLLFDWFVVQARKLLREGAIGEPLTVHYFRTAECPPYRGGPLPPQYGEGGYPFRDLGIHTLYLMEAFLGSIRDVQCHFSTRGGDPNLLYDEWVGIVQCAQGNGSFSLSWNGRPLRSVISIQGTRGTLTADLFCMTVTVRKALPLPKPIQRVVNSAGEALQMGFQLPVNLYRFARKRILTYHGLQMLVAEFYKALAAGSPIPVTVDQARPVVEWTEAIARRADAAKIRHLAKFCQSPTAPILVTGATGFIGRHLVRRLLAEKERIRVFVRREPPAEWLENPLIEIVLGDLGDPAAVERAVAGSKEVFHLGAAMRGSDHDFHRSSVVGTRNVVESSLRNRITRFVFVSSLSVLRAPTKNEKTKITEDWPLEPHAEKRGFYTQSKLEAEKIVSTAALQQGLPAVILRPGRVFGPGDPLLTPDIGRLVRNRLLILGKGTLTPPFIYVDDLVDALMLAASSTAFDGSIFQLVDLTGITQLEIASQYCRAVAPHLKITHLPLVFLVAMVAGAEMLAKALRRSSPFSLYAVRSALVPRSFDCSRALRQLGWRPRVGVQEGLARTLSVLAGESLSEPH